MKPYRIVVDSLYQEPLEGIALQLGHIWGTRGNVKAMVEAIACGNLSVAGSTAFSAQQRQALGSAILAACDRGEWQNAIALHDVFSAFPDEGLQAQVAAKIEPLERPWVSQLFDLIEQEQTFRLAYQDAAGRPFQFSVCGAQFVPHERRTYLDCWALESEGNQDISALRNNWSLRLDRIAEASIIPIKRKWRSLDTVSIEMHLFGGLAHAYNHRAEDTSIEWIEEDVKQVKRSITSSFWFVREILGYGKDCKVTSPPEIVEQIKRHFVEAAARYE